MLAAAKALGVNQSTVQRRLSELEDRLGQQLIERHRGGYRLTELGEQLRPDAERIEAAVAAFERHLASCQKELTGTLRLTCPTTVAHRLTRTPLIDAFQARHPGLRIELVMSDHYLDLAKGEADIAIRAGQSPDENLVGRKIGETRWAVYASRSYVERHGQPTTNRGHRASLRGRDGRRVDELSRRAMASIDRAARDDRGPLRQLARPSPCREIRRGLTPMPVADGDRDSELVRVIDDIPELLTAHYLLTHRDLQRTPRVRAFFDFVAAEIKAFRAMLSGQANG